MSANERQVGGQHYKTGGEEHWDRVQRLGLDYFQGQITKYVERWKLKNGVQDLEKARHFLDKYIELQQEEDAKETEEYNALVAGAKTPEEAEENRRIYRYLNHGTGESTVPPYKEALKLFRNPLVVDAGAEVKADGWVGYTFEGSDAGGSLYRCQACRASFRAPVHGNPNASHICPPEGEPTAGYIDQG